MQSEILELEKILNEEIEAYSKIEEFIHDKKDSLIKCDVERLKNIDYNLQQHNCLVAKLETKRKNVTSKISNENLTLGEIISRIEDKNQARRIVTSREKIKEVVTNIKKQNNICNTLIQHGLKLVEFSINSIANALVPEGSSYNRRGKTNKYKSQMSVSSVIHEA